MATIHFFSIGTYFSQKFQTQFLKLSEAATVGHEILQTNKVCFCDSFQDVYIQIRHHDSKLKRPLNQNKTDQYIGHYKDELRKPAYFMTKF